MTCVGSHKYRLLLPHPIVAFAIACVRKPQFQNFVGAPFEVIPTCRRIPLKLDMHDRRGTSNDTVWLLGVV